MHRPDILKDSDPTMKSNQLFSLPSAFDENAV